MIYAILDLLSEWRVVISADEIFVICWSSVISVLGRVQYAWYQSSVVFVSSSLLLNSVCKMCSLQLWGTICKQSRSTNFIYLHEYISTNITSLPHFFFAIANKHRWKLEILRRTVVFFVTRDGMWYNFRACCLLLKFFFSD